MLNGFRRRSFLSSAPQQHASAAVCHHSSAEVNAVPAARGLSSTTCEGSAETSFALSSLSSRGQPSPRTVAGRARVLWGSERSPRSSSLAAGTTGGDASAEHASLAQRVRCRVWLWLRRANGAGAVTAAASAAASSAPPPALAIVFSWAALPRATRRLFSSSASAVAAATVRLPPSPVPSRARWFQRRVADGALAAGDVPALLAAQVAANVAALGQPHRNGHGKRAATNGPTSSDTTALLEALCHALYASPEGAGAGLLRVLSEADTATADAAAAARRASAAYNPATDMPAFVALVRRHAAAEAAAVAAPSGSGGSGGRWAGALAVAAMAYVPAEAPTNRPLLDALAVLAAAMAGGPSPAAVLFDADATAPVAQPLGVGPTAHNDRHSDHTTGTAQGRAAPAHGTAMVARAVKRLTAEALAHPASLPPLTPGRRDCGCCDDAKGDAVAGCAALVALALKHRLLFDALPHSERLRAVAASRAATHLASRQAAPPGDHSSEAARVTVPTVAVRYTLRAFGACGMWEEALRRTAAAATAGTAAAPSSPWPPSLHPALLTMLLRQRSVRPAAAFLDALAAAPTPSALHTQSCGPPAVVAAVAAVDAALLTRLLARRDDVSPSVRLAVAAAVEGAVVSAGNNDTISSGDSGGGGAPSRLVLTELLACMGRWEAAVSALPLASVAAPAAFEAFVVAAARGGAPWPALRDLAFAARRHAAAVWHPARVTALLYRTALAVGHWADALAIFAGALETPRQLPWHALDDPAIAAGVLSSGGNEGKGGSNSRSNKNRDNKGGGSTAARLAAHNVFSLPTLLDAGLWERALAAVGASRRGPPLRAQSTAAVVVKEHVKEAGGSHSTTRSVFRLMQFCADRAPALWEHAFRLAAPAAPPVDVLLRAATAVCAAGAAPPDDVAPLTAALWPSIQAQTPCEAVRKELLVAVLRLLVGGGHAASAVALARREWELPDDAAAAAAVHLAPVRAPTLYTGDIVARALLRRGDWAAAFRMCAGTAETPPQETSTDVFAAAVMAAAMAAACAPVFSTAAASPSAVAAEPRTASAPATPVAVVRVSVAPLAGRRHRQRQAAAKTSSQGPPTNCVIAFQLERPLPTPTPQSKASSGESSAAKVPNNGGSRSHGADASVFGWAAAVAALARTLQRSSRSPSAAAPVVVGGPYSGFGQGADHATAVVAAARRCGGAPPSAIAAVVQALPSAGGYRAASAVLDAALASGNWRGGLAVLEEMRRAAYTPPMASLVALLESVDTAYIEGNETAVDGAGDGNAATGSGAAVLAVVSRLRDFVGAHAAMRAFSARLAAREEAAARAVGGAAAAGAVPPKLNNASDDAAEGERAVAPSCSSSWQAAMRALVVVAAMGLASVPTRTVQRVLTVPNLPALRRLLGVLSLHSDNLGRGAGPALAVAPSVLENLLAVCAALGLRTRVDFVLAGGDTGSVQPATEGHHRSVVHPRVTVLSSAATQLAGGGRHKPVTASDTARQLLGHGGGHHWRIALGLLCMAAPRPEPLMMLLPAFPLSDRSFSKSDNENDENDGETVDSLSPLLSPVETVAVPGRKRRWVSGRGPRDRAGERGAQELLLAVMSVHCSSAAVVLRAFGYFFEAFAVAPALAIDLERMSAEEALAMPSPRLPHATRSGSSESNAASAVSGSRTGGTGSGATLPGINTVVAVCTALCGARRWVTALNVLGVYRQHLPPSAWGRDDRLLLCTAAALAQSSEFVDTAFLLAAPRIPALRQTSRRGAHLRRQLLPLTAMLCKARLGPAQAVLPSQPTTDPTLPLCGAAAHRGDVFRWWLSPDSFVTWLGQEATAQNVESPASSE